MDFEDDLNDDDGGGGDPLQRLKKDLVDGMREYLAGQLDGGGEAGYTSADIGECSRILDAYLATVGDLGPADADAVRDAVQFTVLSLNRLNTRCGGALIESDQREQLCDIINRGANKAGVGRRGDDLTEEWREW